MGGLYNLIGCWRYWVPDHPASKSWLRAPSSVRRGGVVPPVNVGWPGAPIGCGARRCRGARPASRRRVVAPQGKDAAGGPLRPGQLQTEIVQNVVSLSDSAQMARGVEAGEFGVQWPAVTPSPVAL